MNENCDNNEPRNRTKYTYDADRRRQTMTVSGQSQTSYAFDTASRLTSITQGTAVVSFTHDSDNRRTSLTLPNGVTAQYSYDAASQLTGIVYQGGVLAPANLEYTYDLAGRRTSASGSLASTQLPAAVSSAMYNANNQLTQWGSTAMAYDADGNTLTDGVNSYAWDARNRLVSANSNGATFTYDPLGRRVNKNILTAHTSFLYDGVNPVQELTGTTVMANLLTGGVDERFARTDSTGTSNYLTDALGSSVALTDRSGNSTVQYSYGPFGSISITGTSNNSYTYTGREIDGLGINYYRARYYNPAIGRFISEDPMGFAGSGPDLYAYAGDDPIDFNDPTGLDKKDNCSKLRKQLTLGVQAAINSGLLAQKLAELPIYEAISGAAAPETGGASALLGVYKFVQALGLAESTGGQWYGAVTGKFETAESMEQEGDIAANPIVGVPAYLLTNNPAFAQEAANTLGLVLATGDYVNSGFGRQSIAKGVDMLMNAASVFGTGCKE